MSTRVAIRHFGIDFGTTNTAVVSWNGRREDKLGDPNYEGHPFPSVVAIDALTGETSCGGAVKSRAVEMLGDESHTIVKSVKLALASDERYRGAGREWTAEDIAAELFRELSRTAQQHYGRPIESAVVAIPVGMSASSRAALRKAARAAGIEVASVVSESTAAYFSNAQRVGHARYAAVFDWGGGTLDLSVLECRSGRVAERHTDGWDVAGDKLDDRLAEFIHEKISRKYGLATPIDSVPPQERQLLITQAEACKLALQDPDSESWPVALARYLGAIRQVDVSRDELDSIFRDVVAKAVDRLFSCIAGAKLADEEIGALIVVGGSSRLRMLRDEINRRWVWNAPIFPDAAEWDIARGAALLAAAPGMDELAESIGLVLADDEFHPVFLSGTTVEDAAFDREFGLVEDARSATFVFASQKAQHDGFSRVGDLHLPVFGFRDEVIGLEASITQDLVFQASARSQSRPGTRAPFNFDRLRWRYQLPELEKSRGA